MVNIKRRMITALVLDICVLITLEMVIRTAYPVYARMWSDRDFTLGVPKAGRGYDKGNERLLEPKPEDVRRVAFFGDSITYGFGLPVDQTISAQVERALNEGSDLTRWECINMAGQGTSASISFMNIKNDIKDWKMDALVYQFNMSDLGEDLDLTSEKMFEEWLAEKNKQQPLRWWKVYQKSALYNFVARETDTINYRIGGRKIDLKNWRESPYWRQLAARFDTPEVQQRWQRQFSALATIRDLCAQHSIAFMVIMLPYQFDIADRFPDNFWALDKTMFQVDPYKKFSRMAAQSDMAHRHYLQPLRNARQAMLRGERDSFTLYFPRDVGHLTAEGVEVLAPVLAQDIRQLLK